jgi:hypothetical protein
VVISSAVYLHPDARSKPAERSLVTLKFALERFRMYGLQKLTLRDTHAS